MAGRSRALEYICLLATVLACLGHAGANDTKDGSLIMEAERSLVKTTLEKLEGSAYVRPVASRNDTVMVRFGLSPINIITVDIENSVVVLNVWNSMSWKDEFVKWDPRDHGGVKTIRLPASTLWTPDIHLYNNAGADESARAMHFLVIKHDGEISWVDEMRLSAVCEMEVQHFPFDTQTCVLRFGSWTYSGNEVDMEPQDIVLAHYVQHREWSLSVKSPSRNPMTYECCEGYFVDVTYEFVLERHSQYFQCVFITPAVMIAFLTPTLFVMDHGDKFPIGAGMIVSLTILMEMLDEQTPGTHFDVPILARYYVGLFGMVCLALILATVTSAMRQKASIGSQPPTCLTQCVVSVLGRVVCVRPSDYRTLTRPSILAMKQEGSAVDNGQDEGPVFDMSDRQTMVRVPPKNKSYMWTVMAIVLDRIFFIIYVAGLVVFTVTVVFH